MKTSMISVVIPTLDDARRLPATLACLVSAAIDGLVKEVILADGGSSDATLEIAEDAGARILAPPGPQAARLAAGCAAARGDWLLCLQPGPWLSPDWETAVAAHLSQGWSRAGYFPLSRGHHGPAAWAWETAMAMRGAAFGPRPEQGLLISRRLYDEVGGWTRQGDLPGRIGRGRLVRLGARLIVPT